MTGALLRADGENYNCILKFSLDITFEQCYTIFDGTAKTPKERENHEEHEGHEVLYPIDYIEIAFNAFFVFFISFMVRI